MELTESVNGAYIRQVATNMTPSMYNVASIALLKAANNPSAPVPFFPWKFPLRWETPVFSCTLLQDVRRTLFHLECCWVTAGCVNQLLFANKLMRYSQSYCRFKGSPNCITIGPDGDIKLSEPNFMQQFEIFLSKPQRSAQGRVRGSPNSLEYINTIWKPWTSVQHLLSINEVGIEISHWITLTCLQC